MLARVDADNVAQPVTAAATRLRPANRADIDAVAKIWHDGWRDGHIGHVAAELVALRTAAELRKRTMAQLDATTVAVVDDQVVGFTMVVADEVEQVYVASSCRGSGVAAVLLNNAQAQLAAAGYRSAWLAVVAGNARARSFYAKQGWNDDGPIDYQAAGPNGPIVVPSHRYSIEL